MKNSYFELPDPIEMIDRWLNPWRHRSDIQLREGHMTVIWTERAERKLREQSAPLVVEMQLYFSCVVKKRVLFNLQPRDENVASVEVNDKLHVVFRTVQANSCDPVEFASSYPIAMEYETQGARQMRPSLLQIDHRSGQWQGEFTV